MDLNPVRLFSKYKNKFHTDVEKVDRQNSVSFKRVEKSNLCEPQSSADMYRSLRADVSYFYVYWCVVYTAEIPSRIGVRNHFKNITIFSSLKISGSRNLEIDCQNLGP